MKYTCSVCHRDLESAWTNEEAVAEAEQLWPGIPMSEMSIVCDDCDKKFKSWVNENGPIPMINPEKRSELAKDLAERDRKFWLNMRREKRIEARSTYQFRDIWQPDVVYTATRVKSPLSAALKPDPEERIESRRRDQGQKTKA